MLPGKTLTAGDVLRIASRRGWMIVVPFSIGLALVPVLSRSTPNMYRSETVIRIIPQRVPDTLVRSIGMKMEERLPTIRDLLLSRSQLEKIVKELNLYPRLRGQRSMEDIVQRMRADINLQTEGQETFRLEYVSTDRYTARTVTGRLAAVFIEENMRDRAGLADETNEFLESQLNDAKQQLIQHEKRLELYRRQHAGELPTQLESNLQAIRNVQTQLQAAGESTNRARERRLLIERQLADAQALPADVVAPVAEAGPAGPAPMTTAQQLEAARAQLEANRLRYTPDHPDIRAGERTVRDLQAKLEEESRRQPAPTPGVRAVSPAQAARQRRIADLQAELEVIDHQITAGDAEAAQLKRTMAEYQAKVDAVPTRESELVELTRDYSTLQTTYMSLLTKREDSKIAANLQRREIGEQYRIVDPASLPEKPYNQVQRMGLIASGSVAGLVFGVLVVAFLAFRDASFMSEEDVVRSLSLPVLALVPVMGSRRELRLRRLRAVAGNVAAAAALFGSIAFVVLWRLHR